MENRIKNIIVIINYTFLTLAMISSAILNIKNSVGIIFLYLIILSSYTLRTYFVYNSYEIKEGVKDKRKTPMLILSIFTYIVEMALAIALQNLDPHLISIIVLIIVVDDIAINQKLKLALTTSFIIYIISCVMFYFKFSNDNYSRVLSMLLILPVYIIVFIIFYLIKYLMMQNEIIENSLKDITIKNIEKDNLYKNLREAYSKVESITALRERNKIAAEIHDTVGHTLTTVLVELEASKRLMSRDIDRSKEKLSLAQEQVRKGLNDIRSSVRILERGEDILDFFNSLEALIEDTEKHSEITVKRSIDTDIKIPNKDIQEIIFSALMEGLSNGIRHGKSTAFFFKLSSDKDKIYFLLQDNGTGATVISPGFGLRAMRARVEEVNGTLETTSIFDEGFCLYITFNLKK